MPRATITDVRGAQRILFYGVTGSGKSTAATRAGKVLGLPVHLVDDEIGWLPGWQERDRAEQRELATALAAQPAWVLDSAYGHWSDVVLPRAQVMVALDYPRWLSLARLIRRTAHRWVDRTPICNGNIENARQIFSKDSILIWHFRSYRKKTDRIRAAQSQPHGIPVLRLTHPRQLETLLSDLASHP
ncbi:adenylate kinase [Ornithinimicrobium sp. Y1847]|uniref:adenylate kinase n=1 Tax=unclassified Ornithinimicrobium TaxID=2615080 RepID=UPI003B67139B